MGRKKNRKRERRQQQRGALPAGSHASLILRDDEYDPDPYAWVEREASLLGFMHDARAGVKTCGGCKEFVEDGDAGRGTCLHPGSGILSPWTDTKACAFYAARRR